jgi:hypothetical protein
MSGWYTVSGITEEYWDLIWYPHIVVFRFAGESFRDFLIRTGPLRGGLHPKKEAQEELNSHPRNYALPTSEIKRVTLHRRRFLRLPRLEILSNSMEYTFYSRKRNYQCLHDIEKLREIVPSHIKIEVV